MLSGEPIPVEKKKYSKVYAGTINLKGSFRFLAAKVGADTVLAQIIRMVQEAQGSKAHVQKLVDPHSSDICAYGNVYCRSIVHHLDDI